MVSGSLSSHRQLSTDVLPVHGWRPFYPRRARLYRPLPLVAGLNGLPRLLLTLGAVVVPQIIGLVLVVSLPSRHQCASCALWNFAGLISRERCPARIRVCMETPVVIERGRERGTERGERQANRMPGGKQNASTPTADGVFAQNIVGGHFCHGSAVSNNPSEIPTLGRVRASRERNRT